MKLVVSGETLSYNVGLHTPLLILKNQLAQATQIQVRSSPSCVATPSFSVYLTKATAHPQPNLQVLQLLDTRSAQERDWKDPEARPRPL